MATFDRFLLWAVPTVAGLIALLWKPLFDGPPWTTEISHGDLVLLALPVLVAAVLTAQIEPVRRPWQGKLVVSLGALLLIATVLAYASLASQNPKHPYAIATVCRVSYIVAAATVCIGVLSLIFAKQRT